MGRSAKLSIATRGGLIDREHYGYICCVDEKGRVILSAGDWDEPIFIRSAAKPIQALPVIARGLDEKYGLTDEETALFAGSHLGQDCHLQALLSMLEKTGLKEEDMCMLPCRPECRQADDARLAAGLPLRKLYHNCSGKHVALMLLERDLKGSVEGYWKMDAPCEQEVFQTISMFTQTDPSDIRWGVDGCGVPVFAVPMRNIATAFLNLVRPDRLPDAEMAQAAARYVPRLHQYPHMMKGKGGLCSLLCAHENILAKGGANGLYTVALHKEGVGIAIRTADGDISSRPILLAAIMRKLGIEPPADLLALGADQIINDTGEVVGEARAEITWN